MGEHDVGGQQLVRKTLARKRLTRPHMSTVATNGDRNWQERASGPRRQCRPAGPVAGAPVQDYGRSAAPPRDGKAGQGKLQRH
jgi:hypothetical protein